MAVTSVIEIRFGSVQLANVDFTNVEACSAPATCGVVVQKDLCTTLKHCGSFAYRGGSVSLLNYKKYLSDQLSGFLRLRQVTSVEITGVKFSLNLVASTTGAALISVDNFLSMQVRDCVFEDNGSTGHLILIASAIVMPRAADQQNAAALLAQTHLLLEGLIVKNNFAYQSLAAVTMSGDLLNIEVSDCEFEGNALGGGYIIGVEYTGAYPSSRATGVFESITNYYTGITKDVYIPSSWVTISNTVFTSSPCYKSLLYVKNCVNVKLEAVSAGSNGSRGSEDMQNAIQRFFYLPEIATGNSQNFGADVQCVSLMTFTQVENLLIEGLTSTNNICESTGVSLARVTGTAAITFYQVSGNSSGKVPGSAISVGENTKLTVSGLTASTNSNGSEGIVYVSGDSETTVTLADSEFRGNVGMLGTAIYVKGCSALTIKSTVFKGNSAAGGLGGAVYFSTVLPQTVAITVSSSRFEGNSAQSGAALYITSSPYRLETIISITNSYFTGNSASKASSIYIDSAVIVGSQSGISGCQFVSESGEEGAVGLYFTGGVLTILQSSFSLNSGSTASCIVVQTTNNSETILREVNFVANVDAPAVVKSNFRIYSVLTTTRCTFQSHSSPALIMESGQWTDLDSTFSANTGTAVELVDWATATCTRTVFRNNESSQEAGAVYQSTGSVFRCTDCKFQNNTAKTNGGAIYIDQSALLNVIGCAFTGNRAGGTGAAIYLQSSNSNTSYVNNSVFEANEAGTKGVIALQSAALYMSAVVIDNNKGNKSAGIFALLSSVNITDSTFRRQTGDESPFLSILTYSDSTIQRSTFEHGSGGESGCANVFSSSLSFVDCTFTNITGQKAGITTASSDSTIDFRGCRVSTAAAGSGGSLISALGSALTIMNCRIAGTKGEAVYGEDLTRVVIAGSEFVGGVGTVSGAVLCVNCATVTVSDCVFARQVSTLGAAHFEAGDRSTLTITNTRWENNLSASAGGLYISNSILSMDNCRFENNSASYSNSNGGGLILTCTDISLCNFTLHNTAFIGNSAPRAGGGIYWDEIQPALVNVSFERNSASYGPEVASFPTALGVEILENGGSEKDRRRLSLSEISAAPGQAVNFTIEVSLLDHYGNVVTIDNSTVAEITTSSSATVSGASKLSATSGRFIFDDFLVYADPDSSVSVAVVTTSVTGESSEVPISMRACVPGESAALKSCLVCEERTYSFDPAQPCQKCLSHTECLGNYTVLPDSGYWRPAVFSTLVFECPLASACEGGGPTDNGTISFQGFCSEGYKSNMCQSCDIGYSRSAENKCGKCPSQPVNIVRIIFVSIAVIAVNAVLLQTSLKSALQPKALHSIYFKIMANYWQLASLVTEFKLKWPKEILQLFDAQQGAGGVAEQIYSIDCLLADNGDTSGIYFQKMVYMAVFPVIVISLAVIYWSLAALMYRKAVYIQRELLASIVIAFFIIHPTLMKSLLSLFSCEEIESGKYWLTADLAISCWDSQHAKYALSLGLPAVLLWVAGVPLICLGVLVRNRRRHSDVSIRMQFGFLISGYRPSRYYWEFVIMGRKLAIICCFVFITSSIPIQALTVQFVLALVFLLQYEVQPYTTPELNRMELIAIFVADVTIYSGLFYLTEELSSGAAWFFFVLIVVTNTVFIVDWALVTGRTLVVTAARAVPAVGIRLWPALFERDADIEDFLASGTTHRNYCRFAPNDMKSAFHLLLAKETLAGASRQSSPSQINITEEVDTTPHCPLTARVYPATERNVVSWVISS